VNVVAAQIHDVAGVRKIAAERYQGSMTGERFEKWMRDKLLPLIGEGYTIIMDNASFHRKTQLKELCDKAKVNLLFLPAYSPDLNPIEKSWANMKRDLRDTASMFGLLETAIYNYWCDTSKVA
jgi:transposase